jgi:hypothetical protein
MDESKFHQDLVSKSWTGFGRPNYRWYCSTPHFCGLWYYRLSCQVKVNAQHLNVWYMCQYIYYCHIIQRFRERNSCSPLNITCFPLVCQYQISHRLGCMPSWFSGCLWTQYKVWPVGLDQLLRSGTLALFCSLVTLFWNVYISGTLCWCGEINRFS